MYLTYNECKSVFAKTFIRTLKGNDKLMIKENEIWQLMINLVLVIWIN